MASDEAPWWFKLAVLAVTSLGVMAIATILGDEHDRRMTKEYCAQLSELGHYETMVKANRCWIKLGDGEYDSRWIPAEWMNVG